MRTIKLRKLKEEDGAPMLEWMTDVRIYSKMQYDYENCSMEQCLLFIKNSWDVKEHLHLAISDDMGQYLGTVSLKNIDNRNKNAELGIVVHPNFMGTGAASLALQEIMKIAFVEQKLNKVYFYVRCDNERAVAFYRKNHMEYEGCAREHLCIHGEYKYVFWFCLRKANYNQWRKRVSETKG